MVRDYYIQTELVIVYQANDSKICTIYTNRKLKREYVLSYSDQDSNDDMETQDKKYNAELERRIKQNTNDKMLFENGGWFKGSYKSKYRDYILKTFNQIHKLKKVYKRTYAWKELK
jgi:hypothetical protein